LGYLRVAFPIGGKAVIKLIYLQSTIRSGCGLLMTFAGKLSVSTCSGQNKSRIACAAISSYHRLANADYYPKSCGDKVKYWEIIADNLHDAGFSLGWVSAIDREGRTIWIVDAHGYGTIFSGLPAVN
jgi:hypothetical protein